MTKSYTIKQGDTLSKIASEILGHPSLWIRLALINNLDYPYIGEEGQTYTDNVKMQGDSILVPVLDSKVEDDVYVAQKNTPNFDLATFFLGKDVGLDADGKIVLVPSFDGTDLFTVSGYQNIEQAISNRFKITRGGLLYYKTYGSRAHDYIGKVLDSGSITLLKAEIANIIYQDPRIEQIPNLQVTVKGSGFDHVDIVADVILVSGLTDSINVKINPSTWA